MPRRAGWVAELTATDIGDEEKRLAALASYDILDTPPEASYDNVVQLARVICGAPVALVSFVAEDRQWFKARAGFEACETGLDVSICKHALGEPGLLVIPDLTLDPRTRSNPLVTAELGIRFYAGAPLRTSDDHAIGTLCVVDVDPRPGGLTDAQAEALEILGRQVVNQLELRRALSDREELLSARADADRRRSALLLIGDRLRDLNSPAEMIAAACGIVGGSLGAARAGFALIDADGRSAAVTDWVAEGVASIAGRRRFEDYGELWPEIVAGRSVIIDDIRTDPRTAADSAALLTIGVVSMANLPVRDRGRTVAMLFVHDGRPRTWPPETLAFLRNVADRLDVGIGRLRAEADQRVLNHELSHRMKNTMAMVQAIATQTLKGSPDKAPVDALMRRIHALSAAHDVLLKESWASAKLDAVVTAALANFGLGLRISIEGPEVQLGPRATLSLSMLMHEMATNALKYGALSVDEGRVAVTWAVEKAEGGQELVLDWVETGGPPAESPAGKGFGSRLIRLGMIGTGGSELRYAQSGLEAQFRASLEQVQQS